MYIDSAGRIVASDELKHFGILGMHWGIRRFQPYPKGHTGDGKFVGENSKSGSSGASNVSTGKQERYRRLESHKTGVKEIDDAIAFANKNNIPVKPKWGEVTGDAKESAEIGLKAVNVVRGPDYLDDEYDHTDWFVFEDQTIGMYEVADLARQGKSKEEIKSIVREASKVYGAYENLPSKDYGKNRKLLDDNTKKGTTEALFDLDEFRLYQLRDDGTGKGEQFIDECIKEAEKRKNLKHSYELTVSNSGCLVVKNDYLAHHGILGQRWGRKNGPPYPLDAGDHSAAERKAGWTKSLASVAKATGKGVAKAARATGHGVKVAAKGTKKALIRVNLYPKKLMSAEDIAEKVERMRQEDTLKHAMGKLSNEDKLMLKMKAKDARREVAKQALSQLLPAIGKDLIIPTVKQGILDKLEVKKKEALNDIDLDFKEETNTLDASNKHSEKLWNDVYESALAAGKSLKEAKKIADQGGDKELGKKPSSQEDKERDKKVWNDLYEDARANGKSASEAREIADSGKSDIAARQKNDNGGKGNNGGKPGFDIDSATSKDIYETALRNGFTASEASKMAKDRDDSALRGLFNKSSGNEGGNKKNNGGNNQNQQQPQQQQPQPQKQTKVNLPNDVKEEIAKEWENAGYTKKQAWQKAEAGDDYVGKFKAAYEKQAKDYNDSWSEAIKENNRRDGARKAQETKKFNQEFSTIIKETTTKKGVSVSDKSAQDRLRDAVKAEQERTEKAIKERGGTNIQIKGGKMYYTDDDGVNRVNNFVDRAVDRFEIEERKKKG